MSAIGTGASQFSPDGRVFQVEYAQKAIENSGTMIALKAKDGVVLAVEKIVTSKLYEPGTNKRIFAIDCHISASIAGLLADGRTIVEHAREEAKAYRIKHGSPIPIKLLKDRVAMYLHKYTLFSFVRPFGCSLILASYDEVNGPSLYCLESSGTSWGYKGCAIGKNKQAAKTELEKIKFSDVNVRGLVKEAARIIYMVHDEIKDKAFELEMSWIGKETNGLHQWVPKPLSNEAVHYAQESLKQQSDSE